MKTTRVRPAISQSLDLFIIIGVVLAVGGVVASAATGLIGSATSVPSLQLVSVSLQGTAAGTPDGGALLSLTMKNVGTTTVMVGSSFSVALNTNTITTFTGGNCTPGYPTSYAGATAVTYTTSLLGACSSGALRGMLWTGPSAPVPLAPGQQLTFVATGSVSGASVAIANLVTTGSTYQVTVLGSGQSLVQNVVSV
jgi:hypothetical protein